MAAEISGDDVAERHLSISWRDAASAEDRDAFEKAGFGVRSGFGQRAAVLVIDITRGYVEPRFAKGGGVYPRRAVVGTAQLLSAARNAAVPVFFFRPSVRTRLDAGGRVRKSSAVLDPVAMTDPSSREWPDEIRPLESESIIEKAKSSVFFETPLRSTLTFLGVDTVILAGLSTSGCIQASALDAASCNLRVIVPEECVGDRAPNFHRYALYNINMRYGDVVSLSEVTDWFESHKTT